MQILFVQPNQKRRRGNNPFAETVPPSPCHLFLFFFLETPSFECHCQSLSARPDPSRVGPHAVPVHRGNDVRRCTKRLHLLPRWVHTTFSQNAEDSSCPALLHYSGNKNAKVSSFHGSGIQRSFSGLLCILR